MGLGCAVQLPKTKVDELLPKSSFKSFVEAINHMYLLNYILAQSSVSAAMEIITIASHPRVQGTSNVVLNCKGILCCMSL